MEIIVKKISEDEIIEKNIRTWPIWQKEKSKFEWSYPETEECYILEGKVIVHTDKGDYEINANDYVVFPKGLKCVWEIIEPIKKHYNFPD